MVGRVYMVYRATKKAESTGEKKDRKRITETLVK